MDDDSVYGGLLADDVHWAFGAGPESTPGEDPVASAVAAPVPDGIDRAVLATYCLMLGDDALVFSQRLSEWCSRAPDLEEDIALANIALDLLGQARLLLGRAAVVDPSLVPDLGDSPVPGEDRLAFFRGHQEFRNVRLAEVPNGDFGETIARLLLFATWRLALLERLVDSRDPVLAATAAKGVNELAYHRDFAGRWFLTLARGTDESQRRVVTGLTDLLPLWPELFEPHAIEREAAETGVGVDPATIAPAAEVVLEQVLAASGVERPDVAPLAGVSGRTGRDGMHTEALSLMLAEMQSVARAHPRGRW